MLNYAIEYKVPSDAWLRLRPAPSRCDYYLKASVLHEFGGARSFHLAAPDGETMDLTNHYGSTWYEAGFGGTYRVDNSTYLYADAERSFGSDWHKK
ncbi:autotransporter outer membrane beta-barrel domain-containing protein [Megasphaera sp.]|uniref:autotransporter outer membrane beta-barrel domain-containing protein n=1 Tax=Megasphaera sp. TaxID=2023260 RepID=UPI0025C5ABB9|nr:autotransporter outer membrane beta-barrel domain-containing protein [Megasphaera sp.]MCF0154069.1 autotransporter domain-containing protein [Megasphaera sp.]